MGSPAREQGSRDDEVQHYVTLTQGFWLSTYEITQAQWEAVMGSNPSIFPGDDRPVEAISWLAIQDFLEEMNAKASGGTYQLPTEAQWEYAYRAGTTSRFYWGTDANLTAIGSYSWYTANGGDQTHPVGKKIPNAWGLHDMAGNVCEWCKDQYAAYSDGPVIDPENTSTSDERIIRGGSFIYEPRYCRAANRLYSTASTLEDRYNYVGFRLLRTKD